MASVLGKEPPVAVVAGVQHLPEEAVVQDPQARMALQVVAPEVALEKIALQAVILHCLRLMREVFDAEDIAARHADKLVDHAAEVVRRHVDQHARGEPRSEEQPSELQSLMRISYAVLCLNKKN